MTPKTRGLLTVLLCTAMVLSACQKVSKVSSEGSVEDAAASLLTFVATNGLGQTVTPQMALPLPLTFKTADPTGQSLPGVAVKTCLIDVSGIEDTDLKTSELTAACQSGLITLPATKAANIGTIGGPGKVPEIEVVGKIVSADSRSDDKGSVKVTVSGPMYFGRKIAVVLVPQTKLPVPPGAFITFKTSDFGTAEVFNLQTASGSEIAAGVGFDLFIIATDKEGYQIRTFDGQSEFSLEYNLPKSWAGLSSTLPNQKFTCVFSAGLCLVPGGPFMLAAEGVATIKLVDHAHGDKSSVLQEKVLRGPAKNIVIADGLGGDAAGAKALTTITLAQGEAKTFASALIDAGGNYVEDGNGYTWSIDNDDLRPALPVAPTSRFIFASRASGKGNLTANGALGSSTSLSIEILPGPHVQWLATTEHSNTETAGICFAVKIAAADANGNTNSKVEGIWQLDLNLGGRTESGTLVNDKAHWISDGGRFDRHTIVSALFVKGTATLPIKACLYDATDVAPMIQVSAPSKVDARVVIRGEQPVQVNLGTPFGIGLHTAPFGDPTAQAPCAGNLGNTSDLPCIDITVDDNPPQLYVVVIDQGGNALSPAATSTWTVTGPLAASLDQKTLSGAISVRLTQKGAGYLQVAAGSGFVVKKFYNIKHGAPVAFTVESEHLGYEVATQPFAVRLSAFDQFGNACDTFNGTRGADFTLQGAASSPVPKSHSSVASFSEQVSFTNGIGVTQGTLLQPLASVSQGGNLLTYPTIKILSQGAVTVSKPITVNPGRPTWTSVQNLQNGQGTTLTSPLGLTVGSPISVTIASFDDYGNYVRDEASNLSGMINCTSSENLTCPYDLLSGRLASTVTLIPKGVGTGSFVASPIGNSSGTPQGITIDLVQITSSRAESLRIDTTHHLSEQAGIPFQITISARDHEGNIATTYSGDVQLGFIATTSPSWAGNTSVLPPAQLTCTFTQGFCTLSTNGTPNDYILNDARQVHSLSVYDMSGNIPNIWGVPVTVMRGPAAALIINTATYDSTKQAQLFEPKQSMQDIANGVPSAYNMSADDPPVTFYAYQIDAGGNYLSAAPNSTVWSSSNANLQGGLSPTSGPVTVYTPRLVGQGVFSAASTGFTTATTKTVNLYHGQPSTLALQTQHNGVETAGVPFKIAFSITDSKGNLCDDLNFGPTKAVPNWQNSYNILTSTAYGAGEVNCQNGTADACSQPEYIGGVKQKTGVYVNIVNGVLDSTTTPILGTLYDASVGNTTLLLNLRSCTENNANCYPSNAPKNYTLLASIPVSINRGAPDRIRFISDPSKLNSEICSTKLLPPRFNPQMYGMDGHAAVFTTAPDYPTQVSQYWAATTNASVGRVSDPTCLHLFADQPQPATVYARYADSGGNDLGPASGNWSTVPRPLSSTVFKASSGPITLTDSTALSATYLANYLNRDLSDTSNSGAMTISPKYGTMKRFTTIDDNYAPEPVLMKFVSSGANGITSYFTYTVQAGSPSTFQAGVPAIYSPADATKPVPIISVLQDKYGNIGATNYGFDLNTKLLTINDYVGGQVTIGWHSGTPSNAVTGASPSVPGSISCTYVGGVLSSKTVPPAATTWAAESCNPYVFLPYAQVPVQIDISINGINISGLTGVDLGTKTVTVVTSPGVTDSYHIATTPSQGGALFPTNPTFTADQTVGIYGVSWDKEGNVVASTLVTPTSQYTSINNCNGSSCLNMDGSPSSIITLHNSSKVGSYPASFTVGPAAIPVDLGTITIVPGVPRTYSVTTEHSGSEAAGKPFKISAALTDLASNVCTQISGPRDVTIGITNDNVTAEGWVTTLPIGLFTLNMVNGVSSLDLSATLYNAAKKPAISISDVAGSGTNGSSQPITVAKDVPDHYGITVLSGASYFPKADLSTTISARVSLRDQWGNDIGGRGESGVQLSMVNKSNGLPVPGTLLGSINNIDLTSGSAIINNIAWGRAGTFQLQASKTGSPYTTPVGTNSKATDTIVATGTLATIKNYILGIPPTATAGTTSSFIVAATDVDGYTIVDSYLDQIISNLSFTWAGAGTAPNGTLPVIPKTLKFSQGQANLAVSLYKAETIRSGNLTVSDGAGPAHIGVSTNDLIVQAAPIDHYDIRSSQSTRLADPASTFNLTISAFDQYLNPRLGDPSLTLTPVRISGPTNLGSINQVDNAIYANPSFTMAVANTVTLTNLSYLVPQTIKFTLSGSSAATINSDTVTFSADSATITKYILNNTPTSITAGPNNINIGVAAVDAAGNTVTGLDTYLSNLSFSFSGNDKYHYTNYLPSPSGLGVTPISGFPLTFVNGAATASLSWYASGKFSLTGDLGNLSDNTTPARTGVISTDPKASFTVTPKAATQLVLIPQYQSYYSNGTPGSYGCYYNSPSTYAGLTVPEVAGKPFGICIVAADPYGNLDYNYPAQNLNFAWVNANTSLMNNAAPKVIATGSRDFSSSVNNGFTGGIFSSGATDFALYNASDSNIALHLVSPPLPTADLKFSVSANPTQSIVKIQSSALPTSTVLSGTTVNITADGAPVTLYSLSYDNWGNYLQRDSTEWSGSGSMNTGSCNGCGISPSSGSNVTTITPGLKGTGTITATLSPGSVLPTPTTMPSASVTFNVSAGTPKSLLVTSATSTPTAGQAVTIGVTVIDAKQNICDQINTAQTLYWNISDNTSNVEGRSAKLGSDSFPASGSYSFSAGVMTSTVSATLYNSSANAPVITASTGPSGTGSSGSTPALTVSPAAADHYGIALNGATSNQTINYYPKANFSTNLTAVIQLRDAWGNKATTAGESGVALSVYDLTAGLTAAGTLQGTISGIDLTSGQATVTNLAWARSGAYQLKAAKATSGLYTTPVGGSTFASTTINAIPTLGTIKNYVLGFNSLITAGASTAINVYAVDASGIAISGIDPLLGGLRFNWSGPHSSPNGTSAVLPTTLLFAGGQATAFSTFYNAETIPTGSFIISDNQTTPVNGPSTSTLVVGPAAIDHYEVRSSATTAAADSTGTFNLTVRCYDTYGNLRNGENGIELDVIRMSGPTNVGPLHISSSTYYPNNGIWSLATLPPSNPYILNMASVTSISLSSVYYQIPQKVQFQISLASVAASTTVSDQMTFAATSQTIRSFGESYNTTSPAAGPSNLVVTVSALDEAKNVVTGRDSDLSSRAYTWTYSIYDSGSWTAVTSDLAPDGTHNISLGTVSAFSSGTATATMSFYKTGIKGLSISDNTTPISISSGNLQFTVSGNNATHLVMVPVSAGTTTALTAPYTFMAGQAYDIRIDARDAYENLDTNYSATINSGSVGVLTWLNTHGAPDTTSPYTVALGATAGAASKPSNALTFSNGFARSTTSNLLLYNGFDTNPTLRLTNPPLTTADLPVAVTPSTVTAGQKTLVQSGSSYTSTAYPSSYPSIQADAATFSLFTHLYDAYGNWMGQQATDWFTSGVMSSTLNPTSASNYTNVSLSNSGTGTVTVKSPGTTTVLATVNFTVIPGAPFKYRVQVSGGGDPSTVTANNSFSIDISALDNKGNVATTYNPSGNLTYTLQNVSATTAAAPTSCSSTTPSASTPTFTNGVATVSGFKAVNTADSSFTIKVTGDLVAGTSFTKSVLPGSPAGLWLAVVNGNTVTAGATGFDITVNLVDSCSNPVTTYASPVSLNFSLTGSTSSAENTAGAGVPSNGAKTIAANTGTVTTTGGSFKIYKRTGTNYDTTVSLSVSCTTGGGCPAAYTSNTASLTINPGTLHHLYLQSSAANYPLPSSKLSGTVTTISSTTSGTSATYYAWGYDYYGNAIGLQSVNWTKGSVTNATLSAASGTSTILTPSNYAGGSPASTGSETVTATCSTCTPTTVTITQPIGVGTAYKATVTVPATVTANASTNATIQAVDWYSNPVTSYSGSNTVTVALSGANATTASPIACSVNNPYSTGVATTFTSGAATITGFKFPKVGDTITFQATATGLVASTATNTISVSTADVPAKLWLTVGGNGSTATATAAAAFDVTVQATDACSNVNSSGSGSLNYAFTGAGSSLENTTAPVVPVIGTISLASGTATTSGGKFNLFKRTGTNYDGTITLQATCNSCAYTASNSVTLTVNPGNLHHFYLQNSNANYPLPSTALSGTLTNLTANNTATYYAWGYDQYGNATTLQTATWTKGSGTNATLSPASGTSSLLTPGSVAANSLGSETVTATVSGATPTSITVTQPITYGPLSSFSLTPSGGTTATAGTGFDITATALDVKGNKVASNSSYALTWAWQGTSTTSPNSNAPVTDTNTTRAFTSGVYTSSGAPFIIYSATAASANVKLTSGTPAGQTATITVSAANAASLNLTATPTPTAGVASTGYSLVLKDAYGNNSTNGCGTTTMSVSSCTSCASPGGHGGTVTNPVYTSSPWSPTSAVYTPNVTLYNAAATNNVTFTACGFSATATPSVAANTTVNAVYLATGATDPGTPTTSATSVSCTSGNPVTCQNLYAYAFDAYGNTEGASWSCPAWSVTNANSTPFTTATYLPSLTSANGHTGSLNLASYSYHVNTNMTCTANSKTATALAGPTQITSKPYTFGPFANWSCSVGNPTSTATLTNSSGYDLSGVTFSGQNAGNALTGCSSSVTGVGSSGTCTLTVTGTPGTASGTIAPTGTITTSNSENTYATLANPAGISVQSGAIAPNCTQSLVLSAGSWACSGTGKASLTITATNNNGVNTATLGGIPTLTTANGATLSSNTCGSSITTLAPGTTCTFVIQQTANSTTSSVRLAPTDTYFTTAATLTTPASLATTTSCP